MTEHSQPVSMNNHSAIKRQVLLVIVLLAICLSIFSNTFNNDFLWDDIALISENRYIRHIRNVPLFFSPQYWNDLHPYSDNEVTCRPVRTTTFAIDYYFWKLNPAGYHLTNLLLHMVNVVLVFYLVSIISGYSRHDERGAVSGYRLLIGLPFLTAVFFATHPIHTESVVYIKNRSELLAFMFLMASFLMFVGDKRGIAWAPRLLLMTGSLLSFSLALLSKETGLILPAVLILYIVCFINRAERVRELVRVIPYGLVILLYIYFVKSMIHKTGLPGDAFPISITGHLLAVIETVGRYLGLLAFPVHLNAEHAFSIPASVSDDGVVLSLGILLIVGTLAVKAWRWSRISFFAISFLLVTLLPASNIVFLWSRPVAEQRLYIPSFGFCLLLAWGIHHLYRYGEKSDRSQAATAAVWLLVGMLISGFAVRTIYRNLDWKDPVTFYSRTIKSNPGSARMHNNLGNVLAEQGRRQEAIAQYEVALRLNPANSHAYSNLGVELSKMGRFDEAINCFEQSLSLDPGYASAHSNLGIALFEKGLVEAAVEHYQTAARLKPDVEMLNNLGSAYASTGRLEEALDKYFAALRIEPDFALVLNNLAALLIETGNIEQAAEDFLSPVLSSRQLASVYNGVATIYLQDKEYNAAEIYYRKAVQLDPTYSDGLYNLGLVLALKKEYQAAAEVYARLITDNPHDMSARKRYGYCRRMMSTVSE